MYPTHWARTQGGKPAVINAHSGESIGWQTLDERSNQVAHALRRAGLGIGDHLSLLMENHLEYFEIAWAAFRAGLYITCINRYLTAEEAAYIVNDSGAKAIISSGEIGIAAELAQRIPNCPVRLMSRGIARGWESYEKTILDCPTAPIADETMGDSMLYSSGTTWSSKGCEETANRAPCRRRRSQCQPDQSLSIRRAEQISFAGSAVPRGTLWFLHARFEPWRHDRDDGAIRPLAVAAIYRAVRGNPQPMGAHHVYPHVKARRSRAYAI